MCICGSEYFLSSPPYVRNTTFNHLPRTLFLSLLRLFSFSSVLFSFLSFFFGACREEMPFQRNEVFRGSKVISLVQSKLSDFRERRRRNLPHRLLLLEATLSLSRSCRSPSTTESEM